MLPVDLAVVIGLNGLQHSIGNAAHGKHIMKQLIRSGMDVHPMCCCLWRGFICHLLLNIGDP